jgi:hypothetical protein
MSVMTTALAAALIAVLSGGSDVPAPPDAGRPADWTLAQSQAGAQDPADEFRPLSELPLEEQLPAAPMVVAAYIFALLAFFGYVFTLSRRLTAVRQEMSRLESELKRSGRT